MVMKLIVAAALALLLAAPLRTSACAGLADAAGDHGRAVPGRRSGRPCRRGSSRSGSRELLGQPVIVENIGGGRRHDRRGCASPSRAPDGSMFVFGTQGSHTFSQTLYKKPLYDAVTDFAPVAVVVENSKLLLTRKDLPANNLQEFITYAKANQAKLQFGSAGTGSATHVACVLLNNTIGADITHVPYRGTAPAMQDVSRGPHRLYLRDRVDRAAVCAGGHGETHRAARDGAQPRLSRPADRGRAGPERLRRRWLERLLLPQGHTRADRTQAGEGDERYSGRAGSP